MHINSFNPNNSLRESEEQRIGAHKILKVMEPFNKSRNTGTRVTQQDKMLRVQVADIYAALTVYQALCSGTSLWSVPSRQHHDGSL